MSQTPRLFNASRQLVVSKRCVHIPAPSQKVLRPTVVAIYNYVQPLVAVIVSLAMGIGVVKWSQGLAVLFVFAGVWMVTNSKSRRDMLEEEKR